MSTTQSNLLHEAIQRTLSQRAGVDADSIEIAEAALKTWYQIAARLEPMIGIRGVDTLFSRALYLTSNSFPWLAITEYNEDSAALHASVKTRLASTNTDDAAKASYTLLVSFIELLITLIGDSLTERLLASVWEPPSLSSEKETTA